MINKDNSATPSFSSHSQALISIMCLRLSGNPNKKIAISKSLSVNKPFIVPVEKVDASYITLENFLAVLDARLKAELAYQEEILMLRNNLCEEFTKLCNAMKDENFLKLAMGQRQKIINTVIDEARIEEKAIAEKLFHTIMSEPKTWILNFKKFREIAAAIFWKPLLTPFPIGVVDKLKKLIVELGTKISYTEIERIASTIIQDIKLHMKTKEIDDNDYKKSKDLQTVLEKLKKERKIYNIVVNDISKSESVVSKFTRNCIEKITLVTSVSELLRVKPKLDYDELVIDGTVYSKDFEAIFGKIQPKVTSLKLHVGEDNNYDQMKKCLTNLKLLKNLTLNFGRIKEKGAKAVSAALGKLKNISTLDLGAANNMIDEKEAMYLFDGLKELQNISNLSIDLSYNSIGIEGAKAVSTALKELKNISILNLNLMNSFTPAEGMEAILDSVKKLKNISILQLKLYNNGISMKSEEIINELKLIQPEFSIGYGSTD